MRDIRRQTKYISGKDSISVPENFRYLAATEIRRNNSATPSEIAAQLAFISDEEAVNLLMAYYPDEAEKVFIIN